MKINSVTNNYPVTYKAKSKSTDKPLQTPPMQENNKAIALGGVGAVALGGLIFAITKKTPSIKSAEGNALLNLKQIKVFTDQMKDFAQDIDYRKDLLKALGIKSDNYAVLRPIIGPEEYKSVLKEFSGSAEHYSPGKSLMSEIKDGFDLSGKENGTFRATMHMHTLHSDGKMSIQELLDQSAKYADELAEKLNTNPNAKAKNAPFTVAITDHDTLDGCKEAVKIISSATWKYRNLRVILGCEMSVENKIIPQKLKKPISTHMLLHSINPFDEKLNNLLSEKKIQRENLIKELINKSAKKLSEISPDTAAKLKYEDAKPLYPALKHAMTHIDSSTKDYVQFRTIFSECFEKNKEIQDSLKAKGLNAENYTYFEAKEKYFPQIDEEFGDNYWKKYQKALSKYTSELLGISEEDASKKIVITAEMENFFNEVQKLTNATRPTLDLAPAFIDMEKSIELIKEQKYGFMGIAHPGLTNIGESLEQREESLQGMSDLFKNFKTIGGDRALFAEMHYHYFGALAKSEDWHKYLKNCVDKSGLYSSGGLDTHGKSIFYSDK